MCNGTRNGKTAVLADLWHMTMYNEMLHILLLVIHHMSVCLSVCLSVSFPCMSSIKHGNGHKSMQESDPGDRRYVMLEMVVFNIVAINVEHARVYTVH